MFSIVLELHTYLYSNKAMQFLSAVFPVEDYPFSDQIDLVSL